MLVQSRSDRARATSAWTPRDLILRTCRRGRPITCPARFGLSFCVGAGTSRQGRGGTHLGNGAGLVGFGGADGLGDVRDDVDHGLEEVVAVHVAVVVEEEVDQRLRVTTHFAECLCHQAWRE